MKKSDSQISIAPTTGTKKLSAAQREFNGLIKKIEEKRRVLETWQAARPLYMGRWNTEFQPLLDTYFECSHELVLVLDRLSDTVKLSKADQTTLRREICERTLSLIEDDESLKTLYQKHSGRDLDADQREDDELLKQGLHEIFGVDLGDIDMRSPDAIAEKLREQFQAEHTAHERKTQKKSAQQSRAEKAAVEASQSVREIYRKLASALHPDRESDPAERERKTALMQRVNHAYSERNLLDLLHLQLEVEHIDTDTMGTLPKDRLKHYNRVLREQLIELEREELNLTDIFRQQFDLNPFEPLSPRSLKGKFQMQLDLLSADVKQLKQLIQALPQAPKALKAWLKEQRQQHRAMDLEDDPFDFDDIPDEFFR